MPARCSLVEVFMDLFMQDKPMNSSIFRTSLNRFERAGHIVYAS